MEGPMAIRRLGTGISFRPDNLRLHAVSSGKFGLRTTFALRDPGRIPTAAAPIAFPQIARNQPQALANQRMQLWWAGRWNATWYCKCCISDRYDLPLIQVDDFLRLRLHKRDFAKLHTPAGAMEPGTERDPDAVITPAGTAPRGAAPAPAVPDRFYNLSPPGTRLSVRLTADSLPDALPPDPFAT